MKSFVRLAVPTLCLVAAVGCNRDRTVDRDRERGTIDLDRPGTVAEGERRDLDRSGTTTVTGANVGSVSSESAINRIVDARCAREAKCNNVGTDKHFASRDVCSQKLHADMRDDLGAKECPRGIDQKELNECLESIQKEDCNNPIDMVGRLAACRSSDLCLNTDMPNR
jgi:hypothetical protein